MGATLEHMATAPRSGKLGPRRSAQDVQFDTGTLWPQPWKPACETLPGIPPVPPPVPHFRSCGPPGDAVPSHTPTTGTHTPFGAAVTGGSMARSHPVPAGPEVIAALRDRRKRRRDPAFVRRFGDYHPQELPDDIELVRNPYTGSSVYVWNGLVFKSAPDALAAKAEFDKEVSSRRTSVPAWKLLSPARPSGYAGPSVPSGGPSSASTATSRLDAQFAHQQASIHYEPPGQRWDVVPEGVTSVFRGYDAPEAVQLGSTQARRDVMAIGAPHPPALSTPMYKDLIRRMAFENIAAEVDAKEARIHASVASTLDETFGPPLAGPRATPTMFPHAPGVTHQYVNPFSVDIEPSASPARGGVPESSSYVTQPPFGMFGQAPYPAIPPGTGTRGLHLSDLKTL